LMCSPDDEWNLVINGCLHREYSLACDAWPVDAAKLAKSGPGDVANGDGVYIFY